MPLDVIASQVVYAAAQGLRTAHLFEAAANSGEGWEMSYSGMTVPALRQVSETGVLLTAEFPEVCWVSAPQDTTARLLHHGAVMAFRQVVHPGDCAFGISWHLDTEPRDSLREHADLPGS